MAVKLFFCYAHEDEPLLNKLKTQLSPLRRQGLIELWHDRDISAGAEWEEEIKQQLNTAQIILLLVSPDFMDSDYCYSIEMQRALERHERREARVIPVICRPTLWLDTSLGKLQALPKDARPVISWPNLDDALFSIAENIRNIVIELRKAQEEQARKAQVEQARKALKSSTPPPMPPVLPSTRQATYPPQNYPHNQTFVAIDQPQLEQQQLVSQNRVSISPSNKLNIVN